jgi:nucleoside-diphosphate-sugar epimerase
MQVLITGGAGLLGSRLARKLLERGTLADAEGRQTPISRICLLDVVPAAGFSDPRIDIVTGDISDPETIRKVLTPETRSIFHLAAIVSGQAEAEFDLGMRINFDATRLILEQARKNGNRPRVVFTSSVAVFGGDLPTVVSDTHVLTPQSSYGAQKVMGELLVPITAAKTLLMAGHCACRLSAFGRVHPTRRHQASQAGLSGNR